MLPLQDKGAILYGMACYQQEPHTLQTDLQYVMQAWTTAVRTDDSVVLAQKSSSNRSIYFNPFNDRAALSHPHSTIQNHYKEKAVKTNNRFSQPFSLMAVIFHILRPYSASVSNS